jgi:hypothetical protein
MNSARKDGRRGLGIPTAMALIIPAIILVVALVISLQSSTARRMTSTVWMSYVALELAESAISESAHFLRETHVFPPSVVQRVKDETGVPPALVTFPQRLTWMMVHDKFPPDPSYAKEYRTVRGESRLVSFHFVPKPIKVDSMAGLAQKIARENPGVRLDDLGKTDLVVHAVPLAYRREYYAGTGGWVNWGVVQFRVKVRVNELRGKVTYQLCVDRRFTLRVAAGEKEDPLIISTRNLRTTVSQEDG